MKSQIKQFMEKAHEQWFRWGIQRRDSWMVKKWDLPALSKEEIRQIHEVWPWIRLNNRDLIWVRMYKKAHGFDPYFITDWQLHFILKQTNPYKQVVSMQNKAMLDVYFPEIPFPHCYLKNIRGVYWHNGEILSLDEAAECIVRENIQRFVIKPSVDSGCGKGVKIIRLDSENNNQEHLRNILQSYRQDFVVQEVLRQHPAVQELNPTSINSCRVTSIFIGGVFSYSTILKVGKKGSNVDNWHSSYLIGVDSEGLVCDKGYDNRLNPVTETDNGIVFGGMKLPCFADMISEIRKWHIKYFPNIGIIGWDVIVDADNHIKVIEINTDAPGVVGEQFCSGLFFKECYQNINKLLSR